MLGCPFSKPGGKHAVKLTLTGEKLGCELDNKENNPSSPQTFHQWVERVALPLIPFGCYLIAITWTSTYFYTKNYSYPVIWILRGQRASYLCLQPTCSITSFFQLVVMRWLQWDFYNIWLFWLVGGCKLWNHMKYELSAELELEQRLIDSNPSSHLSLRRKNLTPRLCQRVNRQAKSRQRTGISRRPASFSSSSTIAAATLVGIDCLYSQPHSISNLGTYTMNCITLYVDTIFQGLHER